MTEKAKPVLITTKHRGVFYGYLDGRDGDCVTLTKARCAIYWGTTTGFMELAQTGPTSKSRIGAVADRIELFDVTSIADVTADAEKLWNAA